MSTGPLKNPKHEAFVHNYLKCGDATEAFELTGYTRDSGNAHRLLERPQVQARIRELQDEVAKQIPITIESLIGELEEVRVAAGSKNQFAAAVRAVLGKAQLAGLLVERSKVEVSNSDPFAGVENVDQLALAVADDALEYKIEPYHDFREEDREHLASMWHDFFMVWHEASTKYIEEIRARPLKRVTHLPKALPSPRNGKSDSQATPD